MAYRKRRHHNMPRKHRRYGRHKNSYSMGRRRYRRMHHNAPGKTMDLIQAGLATVVAIVLVRKGGQLLARVLPHNLPQPELIAEAAVAAGVIMAAGPLLKNQGADVRFGAVGGAAGAVIISGLNKTPLGPLLGLESVMMLPAPPASSQQGIMGELMGELRGELNDEIETVYHD